LKTAAEDHADTSKHERQPWHAGLIAAGSFQPATSEAGEQDSELQGDSESSNTENTAPGMCDLTGNAHVDPVLALLQCLLQNVCDLNILFAIVW
jgi:hypothetical protein